MFLYAFEESVDCHLLSSFCDNSNLHIPVYLFKNVLSTMGVSKESISKFLIGNRFHVKLRILSPKAQEIQRGIDSNETCKLYDPLNTIFGPKAHAIRPVSPKAEYMLIKDKHGIRCRRTEYLENLLDKERPTDPSISDALRQLPTIPAIDVILNGEVTDAVNSLKNRARLNSSRIPLLHGSYPMCHHLDSFITKVWTSGLLLQQWKNANFVLIYKNKWQSGV